MDFVDGTTAILDAGGKWVARLAAGGLFAAVAIFGLHPTSAWITDRFVEHGQNQMEAIKQGWRDDCEKQLRAAMGSPTTIAPPVTCVMAGPPTTSH